MAKKFERVFLQPFKSLFFIKYKDREGKYRNKITRLVKANGTLILPIDPSIKENRDVTNTVKIIFGEKFFQRSIFRYFFPKRFIYMPTLLPKGKQIIRVDESLTKKRVKAELKNFAGMIRPRISDQRNILIDLSSVLPVIYINEPRMVRRVKVYSYIMNIVPEIISYFLFSNVNEKTVEEIPDIEDESMETLMVRYYNERYGESEEPDDDEELSSEDFDLNLLSKAKVLDINGTCSGMEKYGFKNFIIPWKITSTNKRLSKIALINGTQRLKPNDLRDTNFIYDFSIIKLIYNMYVAYHSGTKSDDNFVNEFLKRRIIFYIYNDAGVAFPVDIDEIKNVLKWTPRRVLIRLSMLVDMMVSMNRNEANLVDVDKVIDEEENLDVNMDISLSQVEDLDKKKINLNIKKILEKFNIFKTINERIQSDSNNDNLMTKIINDDDLDTQTSSGIMVDDDKDKININFIMNAYTKGLILDTHTEKKIEIEKSVQPITIDVEKNRFEKIDDDFEDDSDIEEREIEDNFDDYDEESERENEEDEFAGDEDGTGVVDDHFVSDEVIMTPKQEKIIKNIQEKFENISVRDNVKVKDILKENLPEISDDNDKYKKQLKLRDKSWSDATKVFDLTKTYLEKRFDYDIIETVRSLEYLGSGTRYYIRDIQIHDESDQLNDMWTYYFAIVDNYGRSGQLVFNVPKPDNDGFLKLNGSKYLFRKQNCALPIVKIMPDRVMCTSHHKTKIFVKRHGDTNLNSNIALLTKILTTFIKPGDTSLHVTLGTVISGNGNYITDFEYDILSEQFYGVEINSAKGNKIKIFFSQDEIRKEIDRLKLTLADFMFSTESSARPFSVNTLPYAIDYTKKKVYIVNLDKNESVAGSILKLIYKFYTHTDELKAFIKKFNPPKQRVYSKICCMDFEPPLIIFLSSIYGFSNVLKTAGIKYEFSDKKPTELNKMWIKFKDGFFIYDQYPVENALLLNGLNYWLDTSKLPISDMEKPSTYITYLGTKGKHNYHKGWMNLSQFFIDHVTMRVLNELKLPKTFLEILLYANMLLKDNDHTKESSIKCYRMRQFEIFSELLYHELVEERNKHVQKRSSRNTLSISRNAIIKQIRDCSSQLLQNFDDSSPIVEAKSSSIVSLKGPGGTNLDQTFKLDKRSYGEDAVGIYALSNTESGSIGTIKHLTMNPSIKSILGFYEPVEPGKLDMGNVVSPDESLIPFVTQVDDIKRVIMAAAQSVHVVPMDNELPIIRTGTETMFPSIVSDTYAYKAKKDGKIRHIDDINNRIYIEYDDGEKEIVDIGTNLSKVSDFFLDNALSSVVKPNEKIVKGQPIAVNPNFFKLDDYGKPAITQGILARCAVFESYCNDEDGSLVSQSTSDRMNTNIIKRRTISLKARSTQIFSCKNIGDHVNVNDFLISFDESGAISELVGNNGLFDEMDEETLSALRNSPKAKYTGKIIDIKVYWTTSPDNMSPSCKGFVNDYIKRIKTECLLEEKFTERKSTGRYKLDITVPKDEILRGAKVDKEGSVVIEFYISHGSCLSTGDKVSYHSSIKSTITSVIPKELEPYTESGDKIDFVMSGLGVFRRMVNSVWITGFMGKVFDDVGRNIANDFLNKIK